MLSLLGKIIPAVLGSGLSRTVASVVSQKVSTKHDENIERIRQAGSYTGEDRTWWDSTVDGINRLVRPGFTFGTLYLFYLAIVEPIGFAASMQALALVPEPLWYLLGAVILFWFGGKKIDAFRKPKPASAKEVGLVLNNIRKIKELENSASKKE